MSDRTRAIIFPHTLGNPAEIDKIMNIAESTICMLLRIL